MHIATQLAGDMTLSKHYHPEPTPENAHKTEGFQAKAYESDAIALTAYRARQDKAEWIRHTLMAACAEALGVAPATLDRDHHLFARPPWTVPAASEKVRRVAEAESAVNAKALKQLAAMRAATEAFAAALGEPVAEEPSQPRRKR